MENTLLKSRIHWVDIAKGLTILCVFLGHTISTPITAAYFIYSFHMPAFFLLSGYFFSAKLSFRDFVFKKLKTVVLPVYTIGIPCSIVVAVMLFVLNHESISWQSIFIYPFIQYGNKDLLWFLPTLFVSFIIFYAIVKITKDKIALIALIAGISGIFGLIFSRYIGITLPWHIDTAFVSVPFLAAGYILKTCKITDRANHYTAFLISLLICAVCSWFNTKYFSSVEMHTNVYGNPALFYIAAFSGSIMIISVSKIISENRIIEFFGKNSIIFYAFEPIQYFTNSALKNINQIIDFQSSVLIKSIVTVFAVAFIAVCSSVVAILINKYLPWIIGRKREKINE